MSFGDNGYRDRSMSTAAASHLSPAFPERAAWGTASKLRAWQQAAIAAYLRATPRDFLAVATPGAGVPLPTKLEAIRQSGKAMPSSVP